MCSYHFVSVAASANIVENDFPQFFSGCKIEATGSYNFVVFFFVHNKVFDIRGVERVKEKERRVKKNHKNSTVAVTVG